MAQIVRLHNNNRNPKEENEKYVESSTGSSTSSTSSSTARGSTTVRARSCAREGSLDHLRDATQMITQDPDTNAGIIDDEQAARFAAYQESVAYYEQSFGQRAGLTLHQDVHDAVMQGCSAAVIIACIQAAEAAPRPSWGYARAVLRRCLASGILTAEDWARDQQRHTAARQPAGAGAQRTYTKEDFARVFTDLGLDE